MNSKKSLVPVAFGTIVPCDRYPFEDDAYFAKRRPCMVVADFGDSVLGLYITTNPELGGERMGVIQLGDSTPKVSHLCAWKFAVLPKEDLRLHQQVRVEIAPALPGIIRAARQGVYGAELSRQILTEASLQVQYAQVRAAKKAAKAVVRK